MNIRFYLTYIRIIENNILALMHRKKRCFIHLKHVGAAFQIRTGNDRITISTLRRWRRYRFGIDRWLERLAGEYGYKQHWTLRPGDTVIDIGANIGEFSIFSASQGAQVISIEADNYIFDILKSNAKEQAIETINCAIWKEDGAVTFYSSYEDADSSTIEPASFTEEYPQRALTLDTIVEQRGIEDIALIKCDAEGAEPEVLAGAKRTLLRTRALTLDCGYERQGTSTVAECKAILQTAGFHVTDYKIRGRIIVFARKDGP
ncbi:FkbM family methyltransferase [Ferruginivarius sediminum]|uniref:FkbM family methyltransferase n=1 Tax=Ferruginivarius sediminum TaxID=2661937 RepID=A0A369TCI9_9PROT|nr:FkbM family methyltransferase [Ferruginivarius sediminum]RDD62244.1 FkbM family methyltransferase [Ferruginivarius sediminum]